jgi:hypothetical protein
VLKSIKPLYATTYYIFILATLSSFIIVLNILPPPVIDTTPRMCKSSILAGCAYCIIEGKYENCEIQFSSPREAKECYDKIRGSEFIRKLKLINYSLVVDCPEYS